MTKLLMITCCSVCLFTGCSRGKKETSSENASAAVPLPIEVEMKQQVEAIIAEGGDLNQREQEITLLGWAVARNAPAAVKLLLENGADPNLKLHSGGYEGPLFEAIHSTTGDTNSKFDLGQQQKRENITKLLLKHGADPNQTNSATKDTPLHKAARGGQTHIAALLIAAGADITARDIIGNTPLHMAAKYGCYEMVQLLKSKGATDSANLRKQTALDLAKERSDEDLYKKLAAIEKDMTADRDYDKTISLLSPISAGKVPPR